MDSVLINRVTGKVGTGTMLSGIEPLTQESLRGNRAGSVYDFEAEFLGDGVGEDFFGDALELFLGFFAVPAVDIEDEELCLADVFHSGVAEAGKSVMD